MGSMYSTFSLHIFIFFTPQWWGTMYIYILFKIWIYYFATKYWPLILHWPDSFCPRLNSLSTIFEKLNISLDFHKIWAALSVWVTRRYSSLCVKQIWKSLKSKWRFEHEVKMTILECDCGFYYQTWNAF